MGLDLDLIVDQYKTESARLLGHTRIGLERNYALFGAIQALQPRSAAVSLWNYEDEGLKDRNEDPYGTPLTELWAGELAKVDLPEGEITDWNRAALAFVKALPWRTRVVLWWH